jgi:hypothetical protein
MRCQRNGCNNPATHTLGHYNYPNSIETKACYTHSKWWVRGKHDEVIGWRIQSLRKQGKTSLTKQPERNQ